MLLVFPPSNTIGQTVYTNVEPFMIGVHFNGDETNPTTSTTEASLGFNLYYEQVACSWKPFSYEYFVNMYYRYLVLQM